MGYLGLTNMGFFFSSEQHHWANSNKTLYLQRLNILTIKSVPELLPLKLSGTPENN